MNAPGRSARLMWPALAALAVLLLLLPFAPSAQRRLRVAVRMEGSEAEAVAAALSNRFGSPYAERAALVIEGLPGPETSAGRAPLEELVSALKGTEGIKGVLSWLEWRDPILQPTGGVSLVIVGLPLGEAAETTLQKLRNTTAAASERLRPAHPQVKMRWTGPTALNLDLRQASAEDARMAEYRVLPVLLLLLLAAFGSAVAASLPVGTGVLAIAATLGASALLARVLDLSLLVQNLASMLGLGLGTDYALLILTRFREETAKGLPPFAASLAARKGAGKTLLLSAGTVAIGFGALLAVPVNEMRAFGIAGLLVSLISLGLSLALLPGILALLGARVEAGRIFRFKQASVSQSLNRWRSWARWLSQHRIAALVLACVPMAYLASQSLRLSTGLPSTDWLPKSALSVQALHALESQGKEGLVYATRILVRLPEGVRIHDELGWEAVRRLSDHLAQDPRAGRVISLPSLVGAGRSAAVLPLIPTGTRRSFLSPDGRETLVEVIPRAGLRGPALDTWVRTLRTQDPAVGSGLAGMSWRIGGVPALNADYEDAIGSRFTTVVALVLGVTLLVLMLGFRAVLAALKAVALNLLTVSAALGVLVLVFQDGHGAWLFGLSGGTGHVFPLVPTLAFALVFGLSMDYEVFLVARVLESRRAGMNESEALAEGLARTGGLITRAAALMVAVFSAFAMGRFLVVQMLGFTLAVAVFLDATLVRMVLGPALLALAGDWNWWPLGLRTREGAP